MGTFERYAPFIQDFIYEHGWESLRSVQVAAADAIFNTDDNVLLTASTAAGKTEAAFFPILTEFWEDPPASVGCIYIGPLKALINDQFLRLDTLCEEAGIPVWRWHGDVAQSHKRRLMKNPSGILQITPESLEAMLLHRHAAINRLFCDLRYVVIDEVHSLLRGDRGNQTLCGIERLSRMANVNPRRIGLSATIGDPEATGAYLSTGTGRNCIIPVLEGPRDRWLISMEHFYQSGPQAPERGDDGLGGKHAAATKSAGTNAPDACVADPASGSATYQPATSHAETLPAKTREAQLIAVEDVWADDEVNSAETGSRPATTDDASCYETSASAASTESVLPSPHANASESAPSAATATGADSLRPPHAAPALDMPAPEAPGDKAPVFADPGIGYIFEHTRGRKCLVFSNSREEAEAICTTLRQYCEANHEPDRFLIHHGNLSSSLRESAEDIMRDESLNLTTVTTATLELGIDIGRLERAFQVDAPFTVSAFLQRMGRTGRRGNPSEMWFVMREEEPESRALLPSCIPWKLLQGCALIQLYLEERWVEPPKLDGLPFSLLYHQTMAILAGAGELSPGELARRVLTLTPFARISTDDFRVLLNHLLEIDHLERTDEGGLIVGLAGERVTNNFKFYAVFQENEEFTVRCESQELGTIVMPPPVGERIAIAGATWIVEEIDYRHHRIECSPVKGRVPAYFGMCAGDINTRILERMRAIIRENAIYPYLKPNAVARLEQARHVARNAHVDCEPLVCLGGTSWALFPWLGSYAFLALERFLKVKCADELGIRGFDTSRPYFIQFTMEANADTFFAVVHQHANEPLDPMELVYPGEIPYFDKYDEFVPAELIRKGFALGVLDIEGMLARVRSWPGGADPYTMGRQTLLKEHTQHGA